MSQSPDDATGGGRAPRRPVPSAGRVLGGIVAPLVISVVVTVVLSATVDAA